MEGTPTDIQVSRALKGARIVDQHLRVLITVADRQNFSRAAEELHMTQPAVSQHIQALEREVGTRLFERTNKYVRLTKAGELVYHHAKDIVNLYEKMYRLVDDMMNVETGEVSIGASYTYGEYLLPHTLARFCGQFPKIRPSITIANTKEVVEQVAGYHLDVGIVEGEVSNSGLTKAAIAKDRLVIIASPTHPLVGEADIPIEALTEDTWILREPGSGTRDVSDKTLQDLEFDPVRKMEFGSTQVIKESVEAGLGISILSEATIRKERILGTLRVLDVLQFPVERSFWLVTANTPFQTKAVSLFCSFLQNRRVSR